jgi:Raf kinase inhibitor-like YbhB/YbcL family protein
MTKKSMANPRTVSTAAAPTTTSGTWDHWVVWNIPPTIKIEENKVPGIQGINSFGKHDYGGPCPPSGTHRYFFKVYALDTELKLASSSKKKDIEKAAQDHTLAKGELIGSYSQQ